MYYNPPPHTSIYLQQEKLEVNQRKSCKASAKNLCNDGCTGIWKNLLLRIKTLSASQQATKTYWGSLKNEKKITMLRVAKRAPLLPPPSLFHTLQELLCKCNFKYQSQSLRPREYRVPTRSPIWLLKLKAMSNCKMTSMNWNQGLISLFCCGTWTANTMSLACTFLAVASLKSRIFSHWLCPQGVNQPLRCLSTSTHFVAR